MAKPAVNPRREPDSHGIYAPWRGHPLFHGCPFQGGPGYSEDGTRASSGATARELSSSTGILISFTRKLPARRWSKLMPQTIFVAATKVCPPEIPGVSITSNFRGLKVDRIAETCLNLHFIPVLNQPGSADGREKLREPARNIVSRWRQKNLQKHVHVVPQCPIGTSYVVPSRPPSAPGIQEITRCLTDGREANGTDSGAIRAN
ncbi:hypothetical protein KM043_002480 [Ampulex compressa]|nr:hypothetical protein KM043_002480 [Ampulex compressa]